MVRGASPDKMSAINDLVRGDVRRFIEISLESLRVQGKVDKRAGDKIYFIGLVRNRNRTPNWNKNRGTKIGRLAKPSASLQVTHRLLSGGASPSFSLLLSPLSLISPLLSTLSASVVVSDACLDNGKERQSARTEDWSVSAALTSSALRETDSDGEDGAVEPPDDDAGQVDGGVLESKARESRQPPPSCGAEDDEAEEGTELDIKVGD